MRKIEIFFLALVAVFLLGMVCQKSLQKPRIINGETKVDTLVIRDTICVVEPKYKTITRVEKMVVPVTDTINVHDTLFVVLDRVQKEYCSPDFNAWVSGYDPKLDSIKIFPKTKIVKVENTQNIKVKSRWGVGVHVGYGYTPEGAMPYVGVGVNYNLFSW